MQVKKGTHLTPFELWYGYSCNVKYYKVYGRKCNILKDVRNGKIDAKSEEGIFLGYSIRSKVYKCLNTNTNKIVESVNVKVDEYSKLNEERQVQEPKGKVELWCWNEVQGSIKTMVK